MPDSSTHSLYLMKLFVFSCLSWRKQAAGLFDSSSPLSPSIPNDLHVSSASPPGFLLTLPFSRFVHHYTQQHTTTRNNTQHTTNKHTKTQICIQIYIHINVHFQIKNMSIYIYTCHHEDVLWTPLLLDAVIHARVHVSSAEVKGGWPAESLHAQVWPRLPLWQSVAHLGSSLVVDAVVLHFILCGPEPSLN